jgi:uncharacterized membrane protein YhaH (DUF805 family)
LGARHTFSWFDERRAGMNMQTLYLSLEGQIGRKAWWFGSLGLVVIAILLGMVVGLVAAGFGLGRSAVGNGLTNLALTGLLLWPSLALTTKRLRDRGRPTNLFWLWYGPSLALYGLQTVGLGGRMVEETLFGTTVPIWRPDALGNAILGLSLVFGLWALVELGFLKGRESR